MKLEKISKRYTILLLFHTMKTCQVLKKLESQMLEILVRYLRQKILSKNLLARQKISREGI